MQRLLSTVHAQTRNLLPPPQNLSSKQASRRSDRCWVGLRRGCRRDTPLNASSLRKLLEFADVEGAPMDVCLQRRCDFRSSEGGDGRSDRSIRSPPRRCPPPLPLQTL